MFRDRMMPEVGWECFSDGIYQKCVPEMAMSVPMGEY